MRNVRFPVLAVVTALVVVASPANARPDKGTELGSSATISTALATVPVTAANDPSVLRDIAPGRDSSAPYGLTIVGSTVFFAADDGARGRELWKSDGTAEGTRLVKDIKPGPGGSRPDMLTAVGDLLYFTAKDGVYGYELWVSDGTRAGTRRIKDVHPGPAGSLPWGFTLFDGHVYFSADDGSSGRELWKTDGTAAGTSRVKDIKVGPLGSRPWVLLTFAGKLFIIADPEETSREVLYVSDGTEAGTVPLRDRDGHRVSGSSITWPTILGSRLMFTVDETELWRTNGTPGGTSRIADEGPWPMVAIGDTGFFETAGKLWKTDGTRSGTVVVKEIFYSWGEPADISILDGVDGRLFFHAPYVNASGQDRYGFWTSDGTGDGTEPVGVAVQAGDHAVIGQVLYFAALEGPPDEEEDAPSVPAVPTFVPAPPLRLWRSDGTADGTTVVSQKPYDPALDELTVLGDTLLFVSRGGGMGVELWTYAP